jgi:hypothetical protein
MIHLEKFDFFKKKKKEEEKEEYKGKKETYRFFNIHQNKNGDLVGDCKNCKKTKVDIADHGNSCTKKD